MCMRANAAEHCNRCRNVIFVSLIYVVWKSPKLYHMLNYKLSMYVYANDHTNSHVNKSLHVLVWVCMVMPKVRTWPYAYVGVSAEHKQFDCIIIAVYSVLCKKREWGYF